MTEYSLMQQQLDPNVDGKISREQFLRVIKQHFTAHEEQLSNGSDVGIAPRIFIADPSEIEKNKNDGEPEVVSEADWPAEQIDENNHGTSSPNLEDPRPPESTSELSERDWHSAYLNLLAPSSEEDVIARGLDMAALIGEFRLAAEQAMEEIIHDLALETGPRRWVPLTLENDQFLATDYVMHHEAIRREVMKFCVRGLIIYVTRDSATHLTFGQQLRAAKALSFAIDQVQATMLQIPLQCTVDYLGFRGFVIPPLKPGGDRILSSGLLTCGKATQQAIQAELCTVFQHLGVYVGKGDEGCDQQTDRLPAFTGMTVGATITASHVLLHNLFNVLPVDVAGADDSDFHPFRPEYVSSVGETFPLHARAFSDPATSYLTAVHHTVFQQAAIGAGENLRCEVIPAFVKSVESRWSEVFDSLTLTTALHQEGINMRYLGLCYENASTQHVKRLFLSEMIARVCKRELQAALQHDVYRVEQGGSISSQSGDLNDRADERSSTTEMIHCVVRRMTSRIIVEFLNLAFGQASADSASFWEDRISPLVLQHFVFSCDSVRQELTASIREIRFQSTPQVLLAFLYHANVEIDSYEFDLTGDFPFDESSTARLRPHSNVLCQTTSGCARTMVRVSAFIESGDRLEALELLKARIAVEETTSGEVCSPTLARMFIAAAELSLGVANLELADVYSTLAVEASPARSALLALALLTRLRVMSAMARPLHELIETFTGAVQLATWHLTTNHPLMVKFYMTMMDIARDREDDVLAFQLFDDAAALMKDCFGRSTLMYAEVRLQQGEALVLANRFEEALTMLDEAMTVFEKCPSETDLSDADTMEAHLKAAHCLQMIAKAQAAQPCANANEMALGTALRAFNAKARLLPAGHTDMIASLLQLGQLSIDLGDWFRALEYYRPALRHMKSSLESINELRQITQATINLYLRAIPPDKLAIIDKTRSRFSNASSSFETALVCVHDDDAARTDARKLMRLVTQELLTRDPIEYVEELITKADQELQSLRKERLAQDITARLSAEDPVALSRAPASPEATSRFASFTIGQRSPQSHTVSAHSSNPCSLTTAAGELTYGARLAAVLYLASLSDEQ